MKTIMNDSSNDYEELRKSISMEDGALNKTKNLNTLAKHRAKKLETERAKRISERRIQSIKNVIDFELEEFDKSKS